MHAEGPYRRIPGKGLGPVRGHQGESSPRTLQHRGVAPVRGVAELVGTNRTITVSPNLRFALTGAEGIGKTTLMENLIQSRPMQPGQAGGRLFTSSYEYLPQLGDTLDEHATALENVQAAAPTTSISIIRKHLARFLLRGNNANRLVSTIAADERSRISLARLLVAAPSAELLAIDEPAATCDPRATEQLVEALNNYQGALIVISSRRDFLARLGLDAVLRLGPRGTLSEDPV